MRRTRKLHMPKIKEVDNQRIANLMQPNTRAYKMGLCTILVSPPLGDLVDWHMSISHPKRYPTWDEVAEARYHLLPQNKTFAMLLPPPEEYVNFHENCFQLVVVNPLKEKLP